MDLHISLLALALSSIPCCLGRTSISQCGICALTWGHVKKVSFRFRCPRNAYLEVEVMCRCGNYVHANTPYHFNGLLCTNWLALEIQAHHHYAKVKVP